jgi:hypothetical protein
VTLPYFFGCAFYCDVLLVKWASGLAFRLDAWFALVCAMMGVMVSVMLALTFRSGRTLQQPRSINPSDVPAPFALRGRIVLRRY